MELSVTNLQKRIPVQKKTIRQRVKQILLHSKIAAELSIVFVDDKKIQQLNRRYLHKNSPTDVLAFDLKDAKQPKNKVVGEIVISLEMAQRNARAFNTPVQEEVLLYLVHGILHLSGYDDTSKKKKEQMRRKEQSIVKKILKK
ncbi:rRNA maturation RNase YbeY [Candidatus Omnitrophota bacterium]